MRQSKQAETPLYGRDTLIGSPSAPIKGKAVANRKTLQKSRSTYRRCVKSDPRHGSVCACGGPKAKQAFTCQACHNIVRGYGTVSLREQNRRWRQTYLGIVGSVGDEDPVRRTADLAAASSAATGELADLIAEQQRDASTFRCGSPWLVSLDAPDGLGHTLHERIAA